MAAEASADTSRGERIKIKIEQHTLTGGLWFAAWLYTIRFLRLNFWQGDGSRDMAVLSRRALRTLIWNSLISVSLIDALPKRRTSGGCGPKRLDV